MRNHLLKHDYVNSNPARFFPHKNRVVIQVISSKFKLINIAVLITYT